MSGDDKLLRGREGQFLALSLLFCLGEWTMRLPAHILIQGSKPVLQLVFKVFIFIFVSMQNSPNSLSKRYFMYCGVEEKHLLWAKSKRPMLIRI